MSQPVSNIASVSGKAKRLWKFLHRYRILLLLTATLLLYAFYVNNLSTNPPGFYIDESSMSYNAYQIYLTGRGEFGHFLPLYFPLFQLPPPHNYLGYGDPVQIYILAALHFIFPPSLLMPRLLSATAVFLAALLLGGLAKRISCKWVVGIIVGLTAIFTPWLFEVSRLAFAVPLYPLALMLFLSALYRAHLKARWSLFDSAVVAVTLALLTYTYSIGRLLGPLMAFGLILFATDFRRLKDVIKTWIAYGLTLLPMLVFHIRNPGALTGRFNMTVGIVTPDKKIWEIAAEFIKNYAENVSLRRLLFIGDPNLRHHITDTGPILAAALIMAVAGILMIAVRHRSNSWWRFILFGLIVSVVPASLTRDPFHMLRLIAFPVFLLILMVPTLMWLLEDARSERIQNEPSENATHPILRQQFTSLFTRVRLWFKKLAPPFVRRCVLVVLVVATLVQAVLFQIAFREIGPKRGLWFDDAYPKIFAAALAKPNRPIYLIDGTWGPAYLHAYWYAIVQGIDLSNFVHLIDGARPPAGSLVLSSEDKCPNCEMILKEDTYILYKELALPQSALPDSNVFKGGKGNQPGRMEFPHGVALDGDGNIFVADTSNGRIQKFSAQGDYVAVFGQEVCKSPKGIVVDDGNIFVADSLTNRILKFKADDLSLLQEWTEQDKGLLGPMDIAVDAAKNLYVADQGLARIVKFTTNGKFLGAWGQKGKGDGEFDGITGVAVDEQQRVYVADAQNARIQIFDANGKFLSKFQVDEWSLQPSGWQSPDVIYDKQTRRLYVSSTNTHEILVFDPDGKRLEKLAPAPPDKLSGPTSLAIGKNRRLFVLNTLTSHVSTIDLDKK